VLQNGRVALDGETDKVMAAFRDAAAARAPRAVPQQAQA
jgi:hypothetical protein